MLSSIARTLTSVRLPLGVVPPVALAMAGDDVLAAQPDGTILHLRLIGREAHERGRWGSSRPVGELALSPSHSHALIVAPGRSEVELRDLRRGAVAAQLGDGRRPVAAAFVEGNGRELVACSRRRFVIELIDPVDGATLTEADLSGGSAFEWDHLAAAEAGRTLLAVGRYFSESNDSLLVLDVGELLADPDHAANVAGTRAPFSDYAWRLAAGPCGDDSVAVFRDPEADAEPEPGEEPGDVEGFLGVYIRDLATTGLTDRIAGDLYDRHGRVAVGDEAVRGRSDPDRPGAHAARRERRVFRDPCAGGCARSRRQHGPRCPHRSAASSSST